MAARGRTPGFQMGAEHRGKIANSNILNCLIDHVTENREMTSSQVTAGIALLKKVMPDLAQTDVTSGGDKIDMPTEIILRAVAPKHDDN